MYFAEFYTRDNSDNIVEACGDRSVIILDGREGAHHHHAHAIRWGIKHAFVAYKLCKGDSFTVVHKRTGMHMVFKGA